MKKNQLIKIGEIIIFILLCVYIFNYCTYVLYNKTAASNFRPFYEMDEKFDVLFLGTSVMTSGISPLDLWHEYGIVSFNLANNGQGLPGNYYALKSALNTQEPRLVVVDVSFIFKTDLDALMEDNGEASLHQQLDNMPMGRTKLEAVLELSPSENMLDFLMPLLYYHGRWKELGKRDFTEISSLNRGGTIKEISTGADGKVFDTGVFTDGLEILPVEDRTEYPEFSHRYIEKIIELCKKRDIDVLFVNFPSFAHGEVNHGNGETLQRMWNELYATLDDGAGYINCMHKVEEIGFDFADDLRDWRHLSISGNEKMTAYLGQYIQETYDIPDRRNEPSLRYWDSDYEKWCDYKVKILERAKTGISAEN